jgi:hypothetical protein
MRKWTAAIPVVASFALSAAVYGRLPRLAHPDFSSLVPVNLPSSGGLGRLEAALLLPMVALAVWLLLTYLAKVRSAKPPLPEWLLNENTGAKSIGRFEPTYETIIFGVTALLFLMHAGLIAATLSLPAWIFQVLTASVGLGMIAIGNVLPRTRPNWIAGVRTRKTLSDPAVWARTHRVAGALMMIAGTIVIVASILAPSYAVLAAIALPLISFPIAHYSTAQMETHWRT